MTATSFQRVDLLTALKVRFEADSDASAAHWYVGPPRDGLLFDKVAWLVVDTGNVDTSYLTSGRKIRQDTFDVVAVIVATTSGQPDASSAMTDCQTIAQGVDGVIADDPQLTGDGITQLISVVLKDVDGPTAAITADGHQAVMHVHLEALVRMT